MLMSGTVDGIYLRNRCRERCQRSDNPTPGPSPNGRGDTAYTAMS